MQKIESNNQSATIIQNVKARLSDNGEIQISTSPSFLEYYQNNALHKDSFTEDNWYQTKVTGHSTLKGINLENPAKTDSKGIESDLVVTKIKMVIEGKCHYIAYSLIIGAEGDFPVAILFPNTESLVHPSYEISPLEGCFCPRNIQELCKCLSGCLNDANCEIGQKFSKIKTFFIVEMEN